MEINEYRTVGLITA